MARKARVEGEGGFFLGPLVGFKGNPTEPTILFCR